jgi:hypothetical protein
MNEKKLIKRFWAIAVASAVLVVPLAVYVLGYFLVPQRDADQYGGQHRFFRSKWQCVLYSPAARLEAMMSEADLWLYATDDAPYSLYDSYLYAPEAD